MGFVLHCRCALDKCFMEEITMCNNCIHKAVCAKYTATGGHVNKCEHFKEERKGEWIIELHKRSYRWSATAQCSRCKDFSVIWAGNFVGIPDDMARHITLENASSIVLSDFCPECGADMRGAEDG